MTIRNLLSKYKLLTEDIKYINSYVGVLWCDPELIAIKLLPKKKRNQKELALAIRDLMRKCDDRNPTFDYDVYEEMTRIGLETSKFYARKDNSWNDEEYDYMEDDLPSITVRRL